MNKLDRWLPFKFRRKNPSEKAAAPEARAPAVPAPFSGFPLDFQPFYRSFMKDPFFRDPFARFGQMDEWFGDFSPGKFVPSVDVADEETALRVTAELPGLAKDDIKLDVDHDVLTIRGEKRNEEESQENGVYRTERFYGHFQRAVPLPGELDIDSAEATFKDGVLKVRFPKSKSARESAKKLEIKG